MATATMKAGKKTAIKKTKTFAWKGINRKGDRVKGELQADSIEAVKKELRTQGVNVLNCKAKPESILSSLGNKIKAADIAVMTRQVATMLGAGVPLVQTLQIIGKSSEKAAVRDLINQLAADVEAGLPFSEALKKHPLYFDDLYCDLVSAGEQSGALETIYDRIATYREKAEALKAKIKKALMYPAMVMLVAVIVTVILLLFVIPQFEEIFAGFGAELPAFTQMVIGLSRFMQAYWYVIFGAIGIAVYLFIQAHRRSYTVRKKTDALMLKIPVISPILHKAAVARFASTLSTTFAAGIPLIDALVSAAGASGNIIYKEAVMLIRNETIAGMQMHTAMRTTNQFPDMVTQMVMIGEESGSLDSMLSKVSAVYEQQVDDAVDGLASLIEPLIMVVIGTIVGGLVIAMYLPIFELGSVVS